MTGGLAFGGDDEDDWVKYRFTVDKVKQNGIIVLDDVLEVELHKTDMRIRLDDGTKARAIRVIDAEVLYERCPLCNEDIREGCMKDTPFTLESYDDLDMIDNLILTVLLKFGYLDQFINK